MAWFMVTTCRLAACTKRHSDFLFNKFISIPALCNLERSLASSGRQRCWPDQRQPDSATSCPGLVGPTARAQNVQDLPHTSLRGYGLGFAQAENVGSLVKPKRETSVASPPCCPGSLRFCVETRIRATQIAPKGKRFQQVSARSRRLAFT